MKKLKEQQHLEYEETLNYTDTNNSSDVGNVISQYYNSDDSVESGVQQRRRTDFENQPFFDGEQTVHNLNILDDSCADDLDSNKKSASLRSADSTFFVEPTPPARKRKRLFVLILIASILVFSLLVAILAYFLIIPRSISYVVNNADFNDLLKIMPERSPVDSISLDFKENQVDGEPKLISNLCIVDENMSIPVFFRLSIDVDHVVISQPAGEFGMAPIIKLKVTTIYIKSGGFLEFCFDALIDIPNPEGLGKLVSDLLTAETTEASGKLTMQATVYSSIYGLPLWPIYIDRVVDLSNQTILTMAKNLQKLPESGTMTFKKITVAAIGEGSQDLLFSLDANVNNQTPLNLTLPPVSIGVFVADVGLVRLATEKIVIAKGETTIKLRARVSITKSAEEIKDLMYAQVDRFAKTRKFPIAGIKGPLVMGDISDNTLSSNPPEITWLKQVTNSLFIGTNSSIAQQLTAPSDMDFQIAQFLKKVKLDVNCAGAKCTATITIVKIGLGAGNSKNKLQVNLDGISASLALSKIGGSSSGSSTGGAQFLVFGIEPPKVGEDLEIVGFLQFATDAEAGQQLQSMLSGAQSMQLALSNIVLGGAPFFPALELPLPLPSDFNYKEFTVAAISGNVTTPAMLAPTDAGDANLEQNAIENAVLAVHPTEKKIELPEFVKSIKLGKTVLDIPNDKSQISFSTSIQLPSEPLLSLLISVGGSVSLLLDGPGNSQTVMKLSFKVDFPGSGGAENTIVASLDFSNDEECKNAFNEYVNNPESEIRLALGDLQMGSDPVWPSARFIAFTQPEIVGAVKAQIAKNFANKLPEVSSTEELDTPPAESFLETALKAPELKMIKRLFVLASTTKAGALDIGIDIDVPMLPIDLSFTCGDIGARVLADDLSIVDFSIPAFALGNGQLNKFLAQISMMSPTQGASKNTTIPKSLFKLDIINLKFGVGGLTLGGIRTFEKALIYAPSIVDMMTSSMFASEEGNSSGFSFEKVQQTLGTLPFSIDGPHLAISKTEPLITLLTTLQNLPQVPFQVEVDVPIEISLGYQKQEEFPTTAIVLAIDAKVTTADSTAGAKIMLRFSNEQKTIQEIGTLMHNPESTIAIYGLTVAGNRNAYDVSFVNARVKTLQKMAAFAIDSVKSLQESAGSVDLMSKLQEIMPVTIPSTVSPIVQFLPKSAQYILAVVKSFSAKEEVVDKRPALTISIVNLMPQIPLNVTVSLAPISISAQVNGVSLAKARVSLGDFSTQSGMLSTTVNLIFPPDTQTASAIGKVDWKFFKAGGGGLELGVIKTFSAITISADVKPLELIASLQGKLGSGDAAGLSTQLAMLKNFDVTKITPAHIRFASSIIGLNHIKIETLKTEAALVIDIQLLPPDLITKYFIKLSAGIGGLVFKPQGEQGSVFDVTLDINFDQSQRQGGLKIYIKFGTREEDKRSLANFVNEILAQPRTDGLGSSGGGAAELILTRIHFCRATTFSQIRVFSVKSTDAKAMLDKQLKTAMNNLALVSLVAPPKISLETVKSILATIGLKSVDVATLTDRPVLETRLAFATADLGFTLEINVNFAGSLAITRAREQQQSSPVVTLDTVSAVGKQKNVDIVAGLVFSDADKTKKLMYDFAECFRTPNANEPELVVSGIRLGAITTFSLIQVSLVKPSKIVSLVKQFASSPSFPKIDTSALLKSGVDLGQVRTILQTIGVTSFSLLARPNDHAITSTVGMKIPDLGIPVRVNIIAGLEAYYRLTSNAQKVNLVKISLGVKYPVQQQTPISLVIAFDESPNTRKAAATFVSSLLKKGAPAPMSLVVGGIFVGTAKTFSEVDLLRVTPPFDMSQIMAKAQAFLATSGKGASGMDLAKVNSVISAVGLTDFELRTLQNEPKIVARVGITPPNLGIDINIDINFSFAAFIMPNENTRKTLFVFHQQIAFSNRERRPLQTTIVFDNSGDVQNAVRLFGRSIFERVSPMPRLVVQDITIGAAKTFSEIAPVDHSVDDIKSLLSTAQSLNLLGGLGLGGASSATKTLELSNNGAQSGQCFDVLPTKEVQKMLKAVGLSAIDIKMSEKSPQIITSIPIAVPALQLRYLIEFDFGLSLAAGRESAASTRLFTFRSTLSLKNGAAQQPLMAVIDFSNTADSKRMVSDFAHSFLTPTQENSNVGVFVDDISIGGAKTFSKMLTFPVSAAKIKSLAGSIQMPQIDVMGALFARPDAKIPDFIPPNVMKALKFIGGLRVGFTPFANSQSLHVNAHVRLPCFPLEVNLETATISVGARMNDIQAVNVVIPKMVINKASSILDFNLFVAFSSSPQVMQSLAQAYSQKEAFLSAGYLRIGGIETFSQAAFGKSVPLPNSIEAIQSMIASFQNNAPQQQQQQEQPQASKYSPTQILNRLMNLFEIAPIRVQVSPKEVSAILVDIGFGAPALPFKYEVNLGIHAGVFIGFPQNAEMASLLGFDFSVSIPATLQGRISISIPFENTAEAQQGVSQFLNSLISGTDGAISIIVSDLLIGDAKTLSQMRLITIPASTITRLVASAQQSLSSDPSQSPLAILESILPIERFELAQTPDRPSYSVSLAVLLGFLPSNLPLELDIANSELILRIGQASAISVATAIELNPQTKLLKVELEVSFSQSENVIKHIGGIDLTSGISVGVQGLSIGSIRTFSGLKIDYNIETQKVVAMVSAMAAKNGPSKVSMDSLKEISSYVKVLSIQNSQQQPEIVARALVKIPKIMQKYVKALRVDLGRVIFSIHLSRHAVIEIATSGIILNQQTEVIEPVITLRFGTDPDSQAASKFFVESIVKKDYGKAYFGIGSIELQSSQGNSRIMTFSKIQLGTNVATAINLVKPLMAGAPQLNIDPFAYIEKPVISLKQLPEKPVFVFEASVGLKFEIPIDLFKIDHFSVVAGFRDPESRLVTVELAQGLSLRRAVRTLSLRAHVEFDNEVNAQAGAATFAEKLVNYYSGKTPNDAPDAQLPYFMLHGIAFGGSNQASSITTFKTSNVAIPLLMRKGASSESSPDMKSIVGFSEDPQNPKMIIIKPVLVPPGAIIKLNIPATVHLHIGGATLRARLNGKPALKVGMQELKTEPNGNEFKLTAIIGMEEGGLGNLLTGGVGLLTAAGRRGLSATHLVLHAPRGKDIGAHEALIPADVTTLRLMDLPIGELMA